MSSQLEMEYVIDTVTELEDFIILNSSIVVNDNLNEILEVALDKKNNTLHELVLKQKKDALLLFHDDSEENNDITSPFITLFVEGICVYEEEIHAGSLHLNIGQIVNSKRLSTHMAYVSGLLPLSRLLVGQNVTRLFSNLRYLFANKHIVSHDDMNVGIKNNMLAKMLEVLNLFDNK